MLSNQQKQKLKPLTAKETWQKIYIDGLVQDRRNSSVSAMELHLSCIKLSIWIGAVSSVSADHQEHPTIYMYVIQW